MQSYDCANITAILNPGKNTYFDVDVPLYGLISRRYREEKKRNTGVAEEERI